MYQYQLKCLTAIPANTEKRTVGHGYMMQTGSDAPPSPPLDPLEERAGERRPLNVSTSVKSFSLLLLLVIVISRRGLESTKGTIEVLDRQFSKTAVSKLKLYRMFKKRD
jgi:hypothetical protein